MNGAAKIARTMASSGCPAIEACACNAAIRSCAAMRSCSVLASSSLASQFWIWPRMTETGLSQARMVPNTSGAPHLIRQRDDECARNHGDSDVLRLPIRLYGGSDGRLVHEAGELRKAVHRHRHDDREAGPEAGRRSLGGGDKAPQSRAAGRLVGAHHIPDDIAG